MKFSINKSELQNAISIVLKGVSTRSTLPVLSGILIEAVGDKIILQATDLELSIQYSAAALVEESGKSVLPKAFLRHREEPSRRIGSRRGSRRAGVHNLRRVILR